ncbi:hypothetical protein [Aeromicrobium piscarium]|uniref:Uncharacterized protein n=1 Tax=Aeromicrobium piscarium TaxID=2590901 RepID=A0A554RHX0_9ACTN|nr:hypothetical protein [Aeromicrobium piscarium]TSD53584.1 hypothetical protein FNM00_18130 [Aeromicrobium piscarium]
MTSCGSRLDLAKLITFMVLHHEQGYVGHGGHPEGASAALLATGKTVIVECARADTTESPDRFTVEKAVLDLHRDSPVPVYVATTRRSSSGQSFSIELCPAHALARRTDDSRRGVPTMLTGSWRRFWRAQSVMAPATAPPTHISSAVELTDDDLRDPQLATRLSTDEPRCDAEEPIPSRHLVDIDGDKVLPWVWQIPHPSRDLFHYAWTDDGYRRVELAAWRERLREHLHRVEEVRTQPGGPALVITRPWRTLRPLTEAQLRRLLQYEDDRRPPWASTAMKIDDDRGT